MVKQNSRRDGFEKINLNANGFTIVELLVVIIVIGILATITTVSYIGITKKADEATLASDLSEAKSQFSLYRAKHGSYPTGLDSNYCPTNADVTPSPDTNYCLKASSNNILKLTVATGATYTLTASNENKTYKVSNNTSPVATITCPNGFIVVPGSATYGTSDFCVMKYEAKNNGSGKAISQPDGTPWVSISQTTATTTASAACTGCHLITEAEWMTIAQNILSVALNWSGSPSEGKNVVGVGYIARGHSDNNPTNPLAASSDDSDGYFGTINALTSGPEQKRTFILTNGEVIWDFAGNVWEWTSGQTTGGQPGVTGETSYSWKDWNASTNSGSLSVNPFPSGTGIANASSWSAGVNNIGRLYSNYGETALRAFLRGGAWSYSSSSGVLSLIIGNAPTNISNQVGFRVTSSGI